MTNRRQFLKGVAGASAGTLLLRPGLMGGWPQLSQVGAAMPKHKPVMVGGKKIKTVDVHCHVNIPEVTSFLKGTPLERGGGGGTGTANPAIDEVRLQIMDKEGIDVEAVSINPFWYSADRDLAARLMDFQNQKLVEMIKAAPAGRFVAFGAVALQFPDLAAKQLEDAMKMGLKGAAIGGHVEGEEITLPKYDVFWAKAEELQAPLFMHPQDSAQATGVAKRVKGFGGLDNVIGNPLETTIFISHMIFEGVLERFPGLRLCCAHGGGFLPSYADRMDHGCFDSPARCQGSQMKKAPTEYLKQLYVDALVFTPEALRHLAAVMGPAHIMLGTDYPFKWLEAGANTLGPVDHVFATPGFSDAQRVAILGGNACKWLGIPTGS
jgi:predicted TIM-barrel fold metal-dependent hydrolase